MGPTLPQLKADYHWACFRGLIGLGCNQIVWTEISLCTATRSFHRNAEEDHVTHGHETEIRARSNFNHKSRVIIIFPSSHSEMDG